MSTNLAQPSSTCRVGMLILLVAGLFAAGCGDKSPSKPAAPAAGAAQEGAGHEITLGHLPASKAPGGYGGGGGGPREMALPPPSKDAGPGSGGGSGTGIGTGELPDTARRRSRLLSGGEEKRESTTPPESPQVWHRDRQRPTFARVYVGDGNSLELVSLHVTTTVEGPRARTVVDHIFRNPHDRQLEGTFEYPLPTGASPSYFAMFLGQTRDTVPQRFARRGDMPPLAAEALASLTPAQLVREVSSADWGTLQEARVVNKERALETYEDIVRSQIDPALL